MQVIIRTPVKFENVHYSAGQQEIEDTLALRMIVAGVAVKAIPDDQISALYGSVDSSNNFEGIINPKTGALISLGASTPETELAVTTNRNAALTDIGKILTSNSASVINITIPNAATVNFAEGEILTLYQANTGALSFVAGAGVTIQGTAPTPAQYLHSAIRKRSGDIWSWV